MSPAHTLKYNGTTKGAWPRSWHSALSPLYLDDIFMYFYFLGSPTGDSQNGASSVNFTEHGFLPDRGCSQPIFHRWSKQESSERGSGDRCSLEDSKIHRKKKAQTDRQWSTFNSWTAPLLRLTQINSVSLSSDRSFLSAKLLQTSNLLFI